MPSPAPTDRFSAREIAEAAGVNKALLYYYFRDKEAIYGAVLDAFFERLLDLYNGPWAGDISRVYEMAY